MLFEEKGISVRVIAHSISHTSGQEILTIESEYPRFIHAQALKHRMHSVNTQSSRAVPFARMQELVMGRTAIPTKFGQNKGGMQSADEKDRDAALHWWMNSMLDAVGNAGEGFYSLGIHKEIVNRLIEPFMPIKEIRSGTDWDNLFELRTTEEGAQDEISVWAKLVKQAKLNSKPEMLFDGDWHLPFVETKTRNYKQLYFNNEQEISLEDAKLLSTVRCAQVSYRNELVQDIPKAKGIFDKLINSGKLHGTPFEHPCTPIVKEDWAKRKKAAEETGDNICLYSANFKGWVQYRKQIEQDIKNGRQYKAQ